LLANGPIGWKSKLQKGPPGTSSVVAEYHALYDATRSTIWFRQLQKEMGFEIVAPTDIMEDNQGCIALSHNHRTDALTKHIDVKYHYTRDMIDEKRIAVKYCRTALMLAVFLTKPINPTKFIWCRNQLGITDVRSRGAC